MVNKRGEISTLVVLGVLSIIGVATLISSTTANKNRNTTATQAYGPSGYNGNYQGQPTQKAGSTSDNARGQYNAPTQKAGSTSDNARGQYNAPTQRAGSTSDNARGQYNAPTQRAGSTSDNARGQYNAPTNRPQPSGYSGNYQGQPTSRPPESFCYPRASNNWCGVGDDDDDDDPEPTRPAPSGYSGNYQGQPTRPAQQPSSYQGNYQGQPTSRPQQQPSGYSGNYQGQPYQVPSGYSGNYQGQPYFLFLPLNPQSNSNSQPNQVPSGYSGNYQGQPYQVPSGYSGNYQGQPGPTRPTATWEQVYGGDNGETVLPQIIYEANCRSGQTRCSNGACVEFQDECSDYGWIKPTPTRGWTGGLADILRGQYYGPTSKPVSTNNQQGNTSGRAGQQQQVRQGQQVQQSRTQAVPWWQQIPGLQQGGQQQNQQGINNTGINGNPANVICSTPGGCGGTCIVGGENNGCGYEGCRAWEACGPGGGCHDTGSTPGDGGGEGKCGEKANKAIPQGGTGNSGYDPGIDCIKSSGEYVNSGKYACDNGNIVQCGGGAQLTTFKDCEDGRDCNIKERDGQSVTMCGNGSLDNVGKNNGNSTTTNTGTNAKSPTSTPTSKAACYPGQTRCTDGRCVEFQDECSSPTRVPTQICHAGDTSCGNRATPLPKRTATPGYKQLSDENYPTVVPTYKLLPDEGGSTKKVTAPATKYYPSCDNANISGSSCVRGF